MRTLDQVLTRADSVVLQEILGSPVVKLLSALGQQHASTEALRALIRELKHPQELICNGSTRHQIIDLLRTEEAVALAGLLGQSGPDPFSALKQASVRPNSAAEAKWFQFLGLSLPAKVDAIDTPSVESIEPIYGLFAHQRRAVRSAINLLGTGSRRAILHMPTGSGKTRMAMAAIVDHLRATEPGLVLWLANSEELCSQAADEFMKAWATLGNRPLNLYRYWAGHDGIASSTNDGILVAGFAKLYRKAVDDPAWLAALGDHVTLMIVDEAHQSIAPTYQHVISAVLARNGRCALLGLTATPGRTWSDVETDRQLAEFFGRNIVSLNIPGYANPIEYLIDKQYLARPIFRTIQSLRLEVTPDERRRLTSEFEVPTSVLDRLAIDDLRNLQIVNEILVLAKSHRRILVFAATVFHAELLAAVLRAKSISARSLTGGTPRDTRADTIAWYKADAPEVRIITNYGVLTTGFDAPRTSAALIARPTTSLVLYSQMVGRATRGPLAGGNATADIVTVVDTALPGFGDMAEAFSNWGDIWRP